MTLVINATHGFHIRNLFDSGLLAALARHFKVVAIADPLDAPFMREEYDSQLEVQPVESGPQPIEKHLEFVRKRIVIKPDRANTISVFSERERLERPIRFRLERLVNRVLGRFDTIRRSWLLLERLLVPGREFDEHLRRLSPAAVVTANYGTESGAIRLLRSARRLGIPSIAIVPSFDNLTSKGVIGARPDYLIVWNCTMLAEAVRLHDFPAERVVVCGGVQFDTYARPGTWPPANLLLDSLGLDASRPVVVVGTITPAYFPYNAEIIELVAEAVADGRLPRNLQILVRLHPQVVDGGLFGDDLAQYKELARRYPFIGLDIPETRRWGTMQPPARNDMVRLAALLSHASALIVPASTLALDGAAVDVPIIGIAFDGRAGRSQASPVERMFHFTHYRPITDSGALEVVRSPGELLAAVTAAIERRPERAPARRALAIDVLGPRDAGAVDRATAAIRRIAARQSP